jgi:hypothetical protein
MVDITPADLFKVGQTIAPLAEPDLLSQINEFMSRLEGTFREGTQFLMTLANISNNPALKKAIADRLGVKQQGLIQGATAATKAEGGPDLDKDFNQLIGMLELFKLKEGDVPLSKLVEWLKANKQTVIDGMRTQLAAK